MKSVALYGGSFDPIHWAHLNLAIQVQERCQLDEVWFCPARLSPDKQGTVSLSIERRLAMVALAIEPFPSFQLIDVEAARAVPSYTFDTLQQLIATHPEIAFHLLIGEDSASGFSQWHRAEEITQLVPLLVGRRSCQRASLEGENPTIQAALQKGAVETSVVEISSTEVRDRIRRELPCAHLVPPKVLDYIIENRLYSTSYEC